MEGGRQSCRRSRALTQADLSLDLGVLQQRLAACLGLPLTNGLARIVPGQSGIMPVILRRRAGSVVEGRAYRVNSILEWGGSVALTRVSPQPGQVLIFSAHLIHGLAVNAQPDTTRIALKFRLGSALPVPG